MFKKPKKERKMQEVNASSMADIAFLLLVFFLMVTRIAQDKGIAIQLPEWSFEEPPKAEVNDRNMFLVLANDRGQFLVEEELANIKDIKRMAKEFITNNGRNPELSDSPQEATISFAYDRSTKYEDYIQVFNELMAAYNELRNEYTEREWGLDYYEMTKDKANRDFYKDKLNIVKDVYPRRLSEAKPKEFGE